MISETIKPRFLETDALGHINNTVVPGWFEGARDPIFRWFTPNLDVKQWRLILARFEITFHSELYYEYPVELRSYISRIGKTSFDVYQEAWQHGLRCASGTSVLVHFDHQRKRSLPLPGEIREIMQQHIFSGTA
ncbi:MAG: acyl-CoA thioesterase [Gammaproteobacteria bacterium]|nr:acyl-CoA thioesterase [Gammaproteobacteria bacterium]MCP5417229.1 acyl-CoA thioesterase [Chromatiaceae bacterium]